MEAIINRLKTIYRLLKETPLVLNRNADKESVANFARVLNTCLAVTDEEYELGMATRDTRRQSPAFFRKFLQVSGLEHLSLMADGEDLALLLGVDRIVTIRYNVDGRMFDVAAISSGNAWNNKSPAIKAEPQRRQQRAGNNDNRGGQFRDRRNDGGNSRGNSRDRRNDGGNSRDRRNDNGRNRGRNNDNRPPAKYTPSIPPPDAVKKTVLRPIPQEDIDSAILQADAAILAESSNKSALQQAINADWNI